MKIEGYTTPHSSFLSYQKDMSIITDMLLKNQRLKKMLYYTIPDCLKQKNLSDKQSMELMGKNIRMVPKLTVDSSVLNYIIVSFDNYTPNSLNPEFRDSVIEFDIICHFDQWQMEDFELRPYQIAGEIDSMFDKQKFTGIGELQFLGANQIILTDEFAGLCLMYSAIHGGEDKLYQPNPNNEIAFLKDYRELHKK